MLSGIYHATVNPNWQANVNMPIHLAISEILNALGMGGNVSVPSQAAPAGSQQQFPGAPAELNIGAGRREGHSLRRNRTAVEHVPYQLPPPIAQPNDGMYFVAPHGTCEDWSQFTFQSPPSQTQQGMEQTQQGME